MGALEAAERELKATGGAGSSSSAQTPATDAAEEAVSHSPIGGAGDEPYAASDDEPMSPPEVPPTPAAASSEHAEGERSGERSGRGSDRRRESGESRSAGEGRSGESRSTFKARVIKEVKTGVAPPHPPPPRPRLRAGPTPTHVPNACAGLESLLRPACRQRCTASSPQVASPRRRTSRSWRATSSRSSRSSRSSSHLIPHTEHLAYRLVRSLVCTNPNPTPEQARDLAHKILSKDPKKTSWDERMPARVQKYVEQLFARDFIYDPSRNKTRKDAKEPKPKAAK